MFPFAHSPPVTAGLGSRVTGSVPPDAKVLKVATGIVMDASLAPTLQFTPPASSSRPSVVVPSRTVRNSVTASKSPVVRTRSVTSASEGTSPVKVKFIATFAEGTPRFGLDTEYCTAPWQVSGRRFASRSIAPPVAVSSPS